MGLARHCLQCLALPLGPGNNPRLRAGAHGDGQVSTGEGWESGSEQLRYGFPRFRLSTHGLYLYRYKYCLCGYKYACLHIYFYICIYESIFYIYLIYIIYMHI